MRALRATPETFYSRKAEERQDEGRRHSPAEDYASLSDGHKRSALLREREHSQAYAVLV